MNLQVENGTLGLKLDNKNLRGVNGIRTEQKRCNAASLQRGKISDIISSNDYATR